MVVRVHLHTVLQRQTDEGRVGWAELHLPHGSTVADVLRELEITLDPESLILVINHRVADTSSSLSDGDLLDLIPAISGGSYNSS